jgi:hypothetical protein
LVKNNIKIVRNTVKRVTTVLKESKLSIASVLSVCRFYNNDRIDIKELFDNIRYESRKVIENIDNNFVLVAHD